MCRSTVPGTADPNNPDLIRGTTDPGVTKDFEITFKDPCEDAIVTPTVMSSDTTAVLYADQIIPYSMPSTITP